MVHGFGRCYAATACFAGRDSRGKVLAKPRRKGAECTRGSADLAAEGRCFGVMVRVDASKERLGYTNDCWRSWTMGVTKALTAVILAAGLAMAPCASFAQSQSDKTGTGGVAAGQE